MISADIPSAPRCTTRASDKPEVVRRMQAVWRDLSDDDWRYASRPAIGRLSAFWTARWAASSRQLEETGQADNTIVLVTSDHGDMMGGHGLLTKGVGTPYEEVYNVPLILHAPGRHHRPGGTGRRRQPRRHRAHVCSTCARLSPLPDAQGRSLRPVLDGSANPADWQCAYAEFFGQRFVYTQRVTWHGEWKYVFTPGGVDELYHLVEDPYETRNLAADPAYRDRLEEMCGHMWRKMAEIDDWSLYNSRYATLRTAPVGPEIGMARIAHEPQSFGKVASRRSRRQHLPGSDSQLPGRAIAESVVIWRHIVICNPRSEIVANPPPTPPSVSVQLRHGLLDLFGTFT